MSENDIDFSKRNNFKHKAALAEKKSMLEADPEDEEESYMVKRLKGHKGEVV